MAWLPIILSALAVLSATGIGAGHLIYRAAMRRSRAAFRKTMAARSAPTVFDPQDVADLPEIARRYFAFALRPGTEVGGPVELAMEGVFLLGTAAKSQSFAMTARQAMAPPHGFVWEPVLRSGPVAITGSDGLLDDKAWTRFWLMGVMPVANARASRDLVRSAQFRAAMEGAIWAPGCLLPGNGVAWNQLGEDVAEITFRQFAPPITLRMKIDWRGAVHEVSGQRWSDANEDKVFRLQPFGGTLGQHSSFGGMTIPTEVAVGNHFGTADYLPFFQARITDARFA